MVCIYDLYNHKMTVYIINRLGSDHMRFEHMHGCVVCVTVSENE